MVPPPTSCASDFCQAASREGGSRSTGCPFSRPRGGPPPSFPSHFACRTGRSRCRLVPRPCRAAPEVRAPASKASFSGKVPRVLRTAASAPPPTPPGDVCSHYNLGAGNGISVRRRSKTAPTSSRIRAPCLRIHATSSRPVRQARPTRDRRLGQGLAVSRPTRTPAKEGHPRERAIAPASPRAAALCRARGGPQRSLGAFGGPPVVPVDGPTPGSRRRSRPGLDHTGRRRRRSGRKAHSGPVGSCLARVPGRARRELVLAARTVRDRPNIGLPPIP